jgi:hypothetical protein
LTIAAGAIVTIPSNIEITINGALVATGTASNYIQIIPATGDAHFGPGENGITVGDGTAAATLTYSFVKQFGGGILVQNASTATITDTFLAQAGPSSPQGNDFLVTNPGATLIATYDQIGTYGLTPAVTDTTHCDTHFNGGTLTVSHSTLSTSAYGTMFYGGTGAVFTYDNWLNGTTQTGGYEPAANVSIEPGVSGDFSYGYFDGSGAPDVAGITAGNLSTTMLVACTGANDATCAGPHWSL